MNDTFKLTPTGVRIVLNQQGTIWLARELILRSAKFSITPLPDDNYEAQTRNEQANTLRALQEVSSFDPNPEEAR